MNILMLNCDLGPLPEHTVTQLRLNHGGIISIRRILKAQLGDNHDYHPDLFIQRELLGQRLFIADLSELPCLKVFWAIDSHLNLFWHHWYAKLFDLTITPHPHLFADLPPEWKIPHILSFPVPGYKRAFLPHAERNHFASFVGVITKFREQRARFAQFLSDHYDVHAQKLPFQTMLERYDASRVLPNESICREFNFRIMEGASSGCCVLTEDIGDDLACNFSPDKEVLTYRHVCELDELLSFLQNRPYLSEKIGKAAWERVQKEHLPAHRWQQLLAKIATLTPKPLTNEDADRFVLFAAIEAARGDHAISTLNDLIHPLEELEEKDDVLAMKIRIAMELGKQKEAVALVRTILDEPETMERGFDVPLCAMCAGLRSSDKELITRVKKRFSHFFSEPAEHPFELYYLLAKRFFMKKRFARPGARFEEATSIPDSALECLYLAESYADSDERKHRLHQAFTEIADALPFLSFNIKSWAEYSLDHQDDWLASFNYAFCALREFRLEEGLAELRATHFLAKQKQETELFMEKIGRHGLRQALQKALASH
ncbi:MAG: glycosyltransferase family 1 protein [Desulfovibrio sp.]|nr:glycosyltransferase family 1 protein [Desulfovibrio sp.]